MNCSNEDGASKAISISHDIEAVILTIDTVDVGKSSGPENNGIALGFLLVLVHGRIACFVGFGLDDLATDDFAIYLAD